MLRNMVKKYFKVFSRVLKQFLSRINFQSSKYWENRYKSGRNSGAGSYNLIANYKANFINSFIKAHDINNLLDFGCGDGNQADYIKVATYLGVDISKTAIEICKRKFINDLNRRFLLYSGEPINKDTILEFKADLIISLDVIYHLVEDDIFKKYISDLFEFSKKYVIIFSTDIDEICSHHHKNRRFTGYIEKKIDNWALVEKIINPYKGLDSAADFFIYTKIY
jgi:SAM-dependent methyltransferase